MRIADANARAEVAVATLRHGWTQQQLIDAVDAVRGGNALDAKRIAVIVGTANAGGDGAAGGGDGGVASAPPAGTRQPGRLVTEAERWMAQLDGWEGRWASVDIGKLRPAQRQRLLDAAARLEARAAALRARLQAQVAGRG